MSVDYSKIQLLSSASSNKILLQGSGTFNVPALSGAGEIFAGPTIPHGFGSSDLIYQVSTISGATTDRVVLPWGSNDGRITQFAAIEVANLVIYFISSDSSGLGAPAYSVSYVYRILVP